MSRSADANRRVARAALRRPNGATAEAAADLRRQSQRHARTAHHAWAAHQLQRATDEYWAAQRRMRAAKAVERNHGELHAMPPLRARTPA